MAVKTRSDLVNQALRDLGVLAAGQTAATEDFQAVDGHVETVIADLSARQIVFVDDPEEIPAEWFSPLAALLANDAAMEFGLPSNPEQLAAENKLRQIVRGRPTYEPMKASYF